MSECGCDHRYIILPLLYNLLSELSCACMKGRGKRESKEFAVPERHVVHSPCTPQHTRTAARRCTEELPPSCRSLAAGHAHFLSAFGGAATTWWAGLARARASSAIIV